MSSKKNTDQTAFLKATTIAIERGPIVSHTAFSELFLSYCPNRKYPVHAIKVFCLLMRESLKMFFDQNKSSNLNLGCKIFLV